MAKRKFGSANYRYETFDRWTLRGRRYYFRFVAPNHEILMQSEGYNRAAARDAAVVLVRAHAGTFAPIVASRRQ